MPKIFKPMLIAGAVIGAMTAGAANAWTTVSPTALTNNTPVSLSVRKASFSDPTFGYQSWAMHGQWATFTAVAGQQVSITVDGTANADFHPAITAWKRPIGTPEQPYTYKGGQMTNLTPAKYVPDHNFNGTASFVSNAATQQHVQDTSYGGSCTDTAELTCATQTRTITDTSGVDHVITAKSVEFWASALREPYPTGANTGLLLEDGTTDIGVARMIRAASFADGDGAAKMYNKLNMVPGLSVVKDGVAGKVTAYFVPNESVQYEVFLGGWNPGAGAATNNPITVTLQGAAN